LCETLGYRLNVKSETHGWFGRRALSRLLTGLSITFRPRAAQRRIVLSCRVLAIARRSILQHPADRLDPERAAVLNDGNPQDLNGRSSSAWAKYALASSR
jgi:hypothetical protein